MAKVLDDISICAKLSVEDLAGKVYFSEYCNAARGASTDKKPRETRIKALEQIIKDYIKNEIQ